MKDDEAYRYHIGVPVTKNEVETLLKEFAEYLESSGGFVVEIAPMDEDAPKPSDELQQAVMSLFNRLVTRIAFGRFEGIN